MARNTAQKRAVLEAVSALNIHATAEQVFDYLCKNGSAASRATVYRLLKEMAVGGQLLNIGALSGSTHYDHNLHDHYHFICNKCGIVIDMEIGENNRFTSSNTIDFDPSKCSVVFNGICNNCNS